MIYRSLTCLMGACLLLAASSLKAEPQTPKPLERKTLELRAGTTTYGLDPATLQIEVRPDGETPQILMPALHAPEAVTPVMDGEGWRWTDGEGRTVTARPQDGALRLSLTAPNGATLDWPLPRVSEGTWLVPDGEGMAFGVQDPFWLKHNTHQHCLSATAGLSFPAFSLLKTDHALTYAFDDGMLSAVCLQNLEGLQLRLKHDFSEGANTIILWFASGPADPLAPAQFYRALLKSQGRFVALADKAVPDLPRLYGAPQAYVWGTGRDLGFLEDLKALGIKRLNLSYDQDPKRHKHLVSPAFLKQAYDQGYLAGPYEAFGNAQPEDTADSPASIWPSSIYPSGCLLDAHGKVVSGFANRGCELSSEALVKAPGAFVPGQRYAGHKANHASQVFIDVDAYGDFHHDYNPARPMTMSRDRENLLARLDLGIRTYHLVLGSENVTAWSHGVAHYSHGTAQAHVMAVWPLLGDKRFNGWWPDDQPPLFYKPFDPTPDEARQLFGPADRLPLFEAVFHDSVIAADRWEFGLFKVQGVEGARFAHSLLYGTPSMWILDRLELKRTGAWLMAAQDDFKLAHGWDAPQALTGFNWETPDHRVQTTRFADGRRLTANFSDTTFDGLGVNCVRLIAPGQAPRDLCPPPMPRPYVAPPVHGQKD